VETIYLLLGSNEGNRQEKLEQAKLMIAQIGAITGTSSIYKTKAWGNAFQDDFLNQAVEIQSDLNPQQLLKEIKQIEFNLGRVTREKWGPRIIDIDILFFGSLSIQTEDLAIPHPHMRDRRFALTPLAELAPRFMHPLHHQSIKELLAKCTDTLAVEKL
jgi:2-amino-4-hydroxy-6-hydroxymethyldihydropteridine diphosphokinase